MASTILCSFTGWFLRSSQTYMKEAQATQGLKSQVIHDFMLIWLIWDYPSILASSTRKCTGSLPMVDANFWRGRCFWGQFFRKHSTNHYEASTRNTWRNALNKLKWFPIEICTNHYQWSSLSEWIASTLSSLSQNYRNEIRLHDYMHFLHFLMALVWPGSQNDQLMVMSCWIFDPYLSHDYLAHEKRSEALIHEAEQEHSWALFCCIFRLRPESPAAYQPRLINATFGLSSSKTHTWLNL